MTSESGKTNSVLQRCAVCKIDLKGRLVYIDDQVENLLGFTREELFGKMFHDFLDEPSRIVIDHFMGKRNNYETFYDSTRLGILAREGHIVPATAVVSLNFIAGNPVNFMVIIVPDDEIRTNMYRNEEDSAFQELLENVLAGYEKFDANTFLSQLKAVSGATTACLYLIHDNSLELRHVAGDDDLPISSAAIPEVSTIHHQVAETGAVYDFTNTDTFEVLGVTPDDALHEYAALMDINESGHYLLRLIFDPSLTEFDVAGGISRCSLALRFIAGEAYSMAPQFDKTDDINIHFTVGLLDSLGLGAMVTDREGNVVGYNPVLYQMVRENDITGDFRRFCEFLEGVTPDHSESPIRECFLNASDASCCNRIQISLPDGTPAMLTVLRLGDGLEDLTSLVAVIPQEVTVGRVRVS